MITTLECDHCGGVAIESDRNGLFTDGDGERCDTCGHPGHVSVDEAYEDEDNTGYASWALSDDAGATCADPVCSECEDIRRMFESSRGYCCEVCWRNPTCGNDCGSCHGES